MDSTILLAGGGILIAFYYMTSNTGDKPPADDPSWGFRDLHPANPSSNNPPIPLHPGIVSRPISLGPRIVSNPISLGPRIVSDPISLGPPIVSHPILQGPPSSKKPPPPPPPPAPPLPPVSLIPTKQQGGSVGVPTPLQPPPPHGIQYPNQNGFCAVNSAFRAPTMMTPNGPNGQLTAFGCATVGDETNGLDCLGDIAWTDASITLSQTRCLNYAQETTALESARAYTGYRGEVGWTRGMHGYNSPAQAELFWYNPSNKQITYMQDYGTGGGPSNEDASNWEIIGKL